MIESGSSWVQCAIWFSQFCYLIAFIPQIILNYRLKTLDGLSDVYLMTFFFGYVAENYYVYCLHFPFPYLIMIPVCTLAMGVIVFQRFYYGGNVPLSRIAWLYGGCMLGATLLIPFARSYSGFIGHAAGWLCTSIWCTYQLPQVAKMFMTRSVKGFSFSLATLCALAALIELMTAVNLGLPFQTILNAARGVLIYVVIAGLFFTFR